MLILALYPNLLNVSLGYKCILNTCEWFSNNYKKVPKFKVVTNLTYLPEELLIGIKKYNIILTVSLDGPEEINNELRISKDTDINVFETVKNNIRRLRKIGCPIQAVECTFTQKHKELGYTKAVSYTHLTLPTTPYV